MTIEQIKLEIQQLDPHVRQDIAHWLLRQNTTSSEPGIVATEDVCGGEARIAGTRIPVWVIAALNAQGLETAAILKAYPTLDASQIQIALNYSDSHRNEVERAIAENEAL
jgi:uncharacterized protein (DUF433 family)